MIQDRPDVAEHHAADQVRHEEDCAEQIRAADLAGEHKRNGECQHVDENRGNHRKRRGKPESVGKFRIGQGVFEVFKADERDFL